MKSTKPFEPLAGGCECNAIRFLMLSAPIITHACHCRTCQRVSGSAFAVNSMIETIHLTLTQGDPQRVKLAKQWTGLCCRDCNAQLWSHHPHLGPDIAFIGSGMLDEGERLTPEVHYFVRSKHPWILLPPGVVSHEALGDPGKAEAVERIDAVLAAAGRGSPGRH